MPYRKYNRRRRMPYRRKRFGRKRQSLARIALKKVSNLEKGVEKKIHDQAISYNVSDSGNMLCLNRIAQGTTQITRVGNAINPTYLGLRLDIAAPGAAATSFLRCMVVQDKQQVSDTDPAVVDVLEGGETTSFLNRDFLGRFKVMYDRTYSLTTDGSNEARMVRLNIPLNTEIRFNGTAATDYQKNAIYLLLVSDQATNTVPVTGTSRLRYRDA